MYLLKLALRPWRTAPYSQFFSALAVSVLLLLAGLLFWMERGLQPVLARLQGEQVVTAYVDPSVAAKDESKLLDTIRVALGAHAEEADPLAAAARLREPATELVNVQWVSNQKFVEGLKEHYPELGQELENLGDETQMIVPRYVSAAGLLPIDAVERLKEIPGVESVESSKDRFLQIIGAFLTLRWVARLFSIGLCLALITGLIHLARMNASLHHEALALLRLWGAGPWTTRWPAVLSGLWVGLLGGALAASAWLSSGKWLALQVKALSPLLKAMPLPSVATAPAMLMTGAALGLLAGLVSGGGMARNHG